MTVEESVMKCLGDALEIESSSIDYQLNPVEDLGMDSVSIIEFILNIEEQFDISFSDFATLSEHMETVGMMVT